LKKKKIKKRPSFLPLKAREAVQKCKFPRL